MFPVLFSIGKFPVSSYGVFLALGLIFGIFLIWRLARAWDLDEEKTLDLALLTLTGGVFSARAFFVIENFGYFSTSLSGIFLINKFPGFSFWGGILGGAVALYFLAKRQKMDFWLVADIASVGFFGGLILSDVGCFMGGCNVGTVTEAFFAVPMVGLIGRRWPVQIIEAGVLIFGILKIWSSATHFHQRGKIAAMTIIYVGIIKLLMDTLKQDHQERGLWAVFVILGFVIYYRVTKQNPVIHLKFLGKYLVMLFTDPVVRRKALQTVIKTCYNQKNVISWKFRNLKKALKRKNVKFS